MTAPRRILEGRTYELVRRCARREYRLQPTKSLNDLVRYALGYAAAKHDVQVHAFVVMSNHYHLLVTDTRGNLPAFMHDFNGLTARALNRSQGRWENFWTTGSYDNIELLTAATVIAKLVYIITNPVKDGAVAHHATWPGLLTRPEHLGHAVWTVDRPPNFFRENGPCPDKTSLQLTLPPALADQSPLAVQQTVARLVAKRERAYRLRGKRCIGAEAVKRIQPDYRPSSREPRRALRPRLAASHDAGVRVAAIGELRRFRAEYRDALSSYRRGHTPDFPLGTYAMRVLFNVPIACDTS